MSAPAMEGGAEEEVDDGPFDVYESPKDPFIGETVKLTLGKTTIGGEVIRAEVSEEGDPPYVTIARPDGERTGVSWDHVQEVNSRVSVRQYGCESCGAISEKVYRCTECGRDLAGEGATVARDGGDV